MAEAPPPSPIISEKAVVFRPKSTLNLQNIISDKSSNPDIKVKNENLVKLDNRKLSFEEVQRGIALFAEIRKDQVAEYSLLNRDFDLVENTIKLHLTNPVEEPLLASIKSDLIEFLKKNLKNEVAIEGILKKSTSKKVIYTNKEKFDHLAAKNPMLLELRDRLGLDTDY